MLRQRADAVGRARFLVFFQKSLPGAGGQTVARPGTNRIRAFARSFLRRFSSSQESPSAFDQPEARGTGCQPAGRLSRADPRVAFSNAGRALNECGSARTSRNCCQEGEGRGTPFWLAPSNCILPLWNALTGS